MHFTWLTQAHDLLQEPFCPPTNFWPSNMIPLQLIYPLIVRLRSNHTYNIPTMTWCNPRRHIPRPPYTYCSKRPVLWNILFIVSEVFFFAGFFWVICHSSLVPTHNLGGCWPPIGNYRTRPSRSSFSKHISPTGIRSINYMRLPQPDRRKALTA